MTLDAQFGIALLQIVWVNVLLSGDNAVVIALACRSLPKRQQKWGIILGTLPAVVLRIVFAVFIVFLMAVPFLKIVGALLLFWIGIAMQQPEEEHDGAGDEDRSSTSIWGAVRTIVVADAVMSLDNVIAIAAAARGNLVLLATGLAISMPLIIFGSTLLLKLLSRFPLLVSLGGGFIGYIGGEALVSDPAVDDWVAGQGQLFDDVVPLASAVLVIAAGLLLARLSARRKRYDLVT
jgi:YjbE family integral membrane protein